MSERQGMTDKKPDPKARDEQHGGFRNPAEVRAEKPEALAEYVRVHREHTERLGKPA